MQVSFLYSGLANCCTLIQFHSTIRNNERASSLVEWKFPKF